MSDTVDHADWSTATHYEGAASVIEPRMFTEADPMTSLIPLDWGAGDEDERRWGATTYVGRGHYRRSTTSRPSPGPDADVEPGTPEAPVDEAPATDAGNRGLLANSRSIAVASLASRLTGFVRSVLIVAALGVADVANSYNAGNNLPNMVYELLLGGVLSSVLVPLLVKAQLDDSDDGVSYTQRLLSLATVALGGLTLLVVLAAPWIVAPFSTPSTRELTSIFATLLLPEIFFYGLGAMLMAVLNIRHSYAAGAWSPVLNNVVMIVTVLVFWLMPGPATLHPNTVTTPQILVLGIGTTLGIAAQALVLVPALRRSGFTWHWRFRAHPHEVGRMREVGRLAAWVLGYVVVSQVGVSVIQHVGVHNGGFTVFTQADLLFQMPYGILVVSLLTAIMPRLSRAAARGDDHAVVGDLALGAGLSALALIPVTALLIVLGRPLGITLFAHGQTSVGGAELIGSSQAWSAFGLFPFALVMLQMRVFYAMRDGRTPTLVNVGMVAVKVALVLVTDQVYAGGTRGIEWLNIATSASYVIGAVVGHVLLVRRFGRLGFARVARTVALIAGASAVGAAAAWLIAHVSRNGLGAGHASAAVGLVGGGVVGIALITGIAWRLRIPELRDAVGGFRR